MNLLLLRNSTTEAGYLTSAPLASLRGETRIQRIAEFTHVNLDVPVLGLPQGNWVHVTRSCSPQSSAALR